jgi:mono/diheme cytochrome c family protein
VSDERTGRELTPRPEEEAGAVTPRETGVPQPSTTAADRFYAGDVAHTVGLTEERAAQVVRQSSNARMVAFLGALFLVLFVPIYWIYDIGVPALGVSGRLDQESEIQYVTDVARGHELYLANCARCHGNNGEGGIGPALNDQGKLHLALTPQGLPGRGHLNPYYLETVLERGGRWVCGVPNSGMPRFLQPEGPLNYREIEEIIAFILAPNDVTWTYAPEAGHGEDADHGAAEPVEMRGWRDPDYEPPPDATTPPACWRAPGQDPNALPGAGTGNGNGAPAAVENPGTPDNPRVIAIEATQQVQWVDPETEQRLTSIPIVEGETVEFEIINETPVEHNFHLGTAEELEAASGDVDLPGVPTFTNGTETYTHTFDTIPENFQFACTVLGHYQTMHGDFVVVEAGGGAGEGEPTNGEGEPTNGEGEPAGSPAASPAGTAP